MKAEITSLSSRQRILSTAFVNVNIDHRTSLSDIGISLARPLGTIEVSQPSRLRPHLTFSSYLYNALWIYRLACSASSRNYHVSLIRHLHEFTAPTWSAVLICCVIYCGLLCSGISASNSTLIIDFYLHWIICDFEHANKRNFRPDSETVSHRSWWLFGHIYRKVRWWYYIFCLIFFHSIPFNVIKACRELIPFFEWANVVNIKLIPKWLCLFVTTIDWVNFYHATQLLDRNTFYRNDLVIYKWV